MRDLVLLVLCLRTRVGMHRFSVDFFIFLEILVDKVYLIHVIGLAVYILFRPLFIILLLLLELTFLVDGSKNGLLL